MILPRWRAVVAQPGLARTVDPPIARGVDDRAILDLPIVARVSVEPVVFGWEIFEIVSQL